MDIQSILGKLDQIEAPEKSVSVQLPKKAQLTEADQLRVLSGQKPILTESKKEDNLKPKEKQKADTKKVTKSKKDETDETDEVIESSDAQTAAREKFKAMVADKKASKKDTNKKDDKKSNKNIKKGPAKNSVDKKEVDKKEVDKKEVDKKPIKKTVKESYEPRLTFKDMIRLVQESGGQQRIDPLDTELFEWANRVALTKFTDNTKKEVYAGLVYERMGGRFEMHDILSESFDDENEQDLEEDIYADIKNYLLKSKNDLRTTPIGIVNFLEKISSEGKHKITPIKTTVVPMRTPDGTKLETLQIIYKISFAHYASPVKGFEGDFNTQAEKLIDSRLNYINQDKDLEDLKVRIQPYDQWQVNEKVHSRQYVFTLPH
jgi:hypothetical protein